ncbi:short-chain dehydrogenase/reductase SDR [[Actinomadura] parvosata subsp. kistnae]|uniref:Short-chain dehydrogenase n=1 Tax=[Actinomadura] parvosata subsp. kistnae TaxID=1909395 RepID=A0A1U9ZV25_9ACTN|nr:SDR family oxidoreductase [Nonomuraea sp. ATCC 55076]AQZ61790.1 short-chain dehydrogenase [Nonomuraea sp. ATCC 55076]SPL87916.1 short-chain dehydrogenase/reductase SDR [Actinomadura parvosata subsp. kistnae]
MSTADVSGKSLAELVSLQGRRAVVTGGARGLGRAIAARLAEAGAEVLLGDLDGDLAVAAAGELSERHGVRVAGAAMDVTDAASVAAVADRAVSELGGLEIWVNNAGIFPAVPLLEMSERTWDQVFAVNARGVFVGAREAARRMSRAGTGGVIVNIVSTAGFRGSAPGLAAYVGSKHAARGLTRELALELAPMGIRVLGVAPSFVPTEGNLAMAAAAGVNLADLPPTGLMLNSPIGRVGTPDDIARVALFCASDLSAFMTGSTLLADGGDTA